MAQKHQDIPPKAAVWVKDNPQWYKEEPTEALTPEIIDILTNYSKIPSSEVIPHIKDLREKAWDIFHYPCVGVFGFIILSIIDANQVFSYSSLLSSIKNGQTLLDVGCCFGQDIRKLIYDGAPAENIYGSDLRPEFVELGYELFRDKQTLKTKMITPSDIFDVRDEKGGLYDLVQKGGVDIIHAAWFIHLFDWNGQVEVCYLLTKLLKKKKGSRIVGRQVGAGEGTASEVPSKLGANEKTMWLHDTKSWDRLWQEVEKRTGVVGEWEVKSEVTVHHVDRWVPDEEGKEQKVENSVNDLFLFWFEVVRK